MSAHELALQKALIAHLKADPAVRALLGETARMCSIRRSSSVILQQKCSMTQDARNLGCWLCWKMLSSTGVLASATT